MDISGKSDTCGKANSRDFLSVQMHLGEMKMEQSIIAHRCSGLSLSTLVSRFLFLKLRDFVGLVILMNVDNLKIKCVKSSLTESSVQTNCSLLFYSSLNLPELTHHSQEGPYHFQRNLTIHSL